MCPSGRRPTGLDAESLAELELSLLRALCNQAINSPRAWTRLANEFAEYRWWQPDHQVVFEALRKVGVCDRQTLLQQLPSEATRMGFPEISWDRYFTPAQGALSAAYVDNLIRALKSKSRQE
jgi:hypothetical protein